MTNFKPSRLKKGFSLIEVVLCLGIASLTLFPILALLSLSATDMKESLSRASAVESIRVVQAAVNAQSPSSSRGSDFTLGAPLRAKTGPIEWSVGGAPQAYDFMVGQSGEILKEGPGSGVLHIELFPCERIPRTSILNGPLRVYLSVAWPATARYEKGKGWVGAKNFIETVYFQSINL